MKILDRKRSNSLGMLILNIVLICAIIINGTYAWIHIGQSVNGALLYLNEDYIVELYKYQKDVDGVILEDEDENPIPMEGVGFALYDADTETQIGDKIFYTNEEGKIITTIALGNYYFKEVYYLNGWGPDLDEEMNEISQYDFIISDEQDKEVPYVLEVYNRPLKTSLEVEKTVQNQDGSELTVEQLAQEFEFTITFDNDIEYDYYILDINGEIKEPTETDEINTISEDRINELVEDIDSTEEVQTLNSVVNEDGDYVTYLYDELSYSYSNNDITLMNVSQTIKSGDTFYLKHGEVFVIDYISIDTYYKVVETKQANYFTTSENASGNIVFGVNTAEFVNIYVTVYTTISVTKEVQGDGFDPDKEFQFTATFNDVELDPFTLKDGETHIFEDVPVGITYKVEESDYTSEGYTATVINYEGVVRDENEIILEFINIFDVFNTVGDLVIRKEVITSSGVIPEDEEFVFEVIFENEADPENPVIKEVILKAGEYNVIENIAVGTKFTIKETDSLEYIPDFDEISGVIAGKKYDSELELDDQDLQIVTFYNRDYEVRTLTVTKIVVGDIPQADKDKEFEFTITVNDEEEFFTLKDRETKEFKVPLYAQYEVVEKNYIDEGYSQTVYNGSGTILLDLIEVVFVNDYIKELVDITGVKTWDPTIFDESLKPDSITVHLMLDGAIIDTRLVEPNELGDWTYAFQVPKDDAYGVPYEYYVREAEVANFLPEYDDEFNIYNEYVIETLVELPIIEKQIVGISSTQTKFTFILKGIDGAPMPSGTGTDQFVYVEYGAGEQLLGNIKYTKPGTYKYIIYELDDENENWIYDDLVYNLDVIVELDEVTRILTGKEYLDDGVELVDRAIFINEYIGDDVGDGENPDGENPDGENPDGENPDGENPDGENPGEGTHIYVEGVKTWDHGMNSVEHQPSSLVVYVLGDGEVYQAIETSAYKNWSYKFTVPIYNEDGKEIKYTIGEEPVEGYKGVAIGYNLYNTFDLSSLVEPDSPQTSDYSQIWIWVWGLVASTITFVFVNRRKRTLRHGRRW